MTDEKLNGYLDRLRQNLIVLDEQIVNARKMSRVKDKRVALQAMKTVRDLVELRNATLEKIKLSLLGRDATTGSPNEPHACFDGNAEVEFERLFDKFVSKAWTREDLRLECDECHTKGIDVTECILPAGRDPFGLPAIEHRDLCDLCFQKLSGKR